MISRMLRNTLVSTFALALAAHGIAFAQEEGEEGGGEEGGGEVTEGGGEGGGGEEMATGGEVSGGVGMGPFTKAGYPEAAIDRPLTLVKGMIEITPQYGFIKIGDANAGSLNLNIGYGIMDKLDVNLNTGFALHPDAAYSKSIGIGVHYLVIDQAKLDLAAGVTTALDFNEGADVISGLSIDALTRFLLTDKIWVQGGQGLIGLGFSGDFALSLHVIAGLGIQVTPKIAALLNLPLANLNVTPSGGSTFIFADFIPVNLMALYALSNKLDVTAQVLLDLKQTDPFFFGFTVGVNVRL